MTPDKTPTRALLKLSGDALSGPEGPVDAERLRYIVKELKSAREVCPQLAVVLGGGNIMRGTQVSSGGIRRHRADQCGMMATVVNVLALAGEMGEAGVEAEVMSAVDIPGIAEGFDVERGLQYMKQGKVLLLAAGTGNSYFTTDSAAALRAVQLSADIMLKATRVRGVFSADPEKDKEAEFYKGISFREVLSQKLGVMDLTAATMCMEHGLPVKIFNYDTSGNLCKALRGEPIGTLIRGGNHGD